jgi:uncharacterized protein
MIEAGKKKQEAGRRRILPAFVCALLLSPFFLLPVSAHAYTSPGKPAGYVNDFAAVLSSADRQSLESKLVSLKSQTSADVVIVTVPSLGDETVDSYAVKLFEEWGLGQGGKDNGVLVLVAPAEKHSRIEVGYGLEGDLTDLQSGNIIRDVMNPAFKNGDYAAGLNGAVDAISAVITNSPEAETYSAPSTSSGTSFNFAGAFFLGVIVLNALARMLGRTKSWWLGGVLGGVIGVVIGFVIGSVLAGGIITIILIALGLLFDFIVSRRPPGSGGSGGFWPIFLGGGRGGMGGGGFGGFGGGRSGGGGASGGW